MAKSNEIKECLNDYQSFEADYDDLRYNDSDDNQLKMLDSMFKAICTQSVIQFIGQESAGNMNKYKRIDYNADTIEYTGNYKLVCNLAILKLKK